MGHAFGVVKGHQPPLVVQIDPDPGQGLLQTQNLWWRSTGHVLDPVGEGEGPEAVGREGFDDPLSGHGLSGDPDGPHGAAVDLDLPVVAPVGETLAAQEGQGGVEPVGVVLHRVVESLVADAGEGGGEAEPGVGCAGVECDGCRNFREKRINDSFFSSAPTKGPSLVLPSPLNFLFILSIIKHRNDYEAHSSTHFLWFLSGSSPAWLLRCVSPVSLFVSTCTSLSLALPHLYKVR